MIAGCVGPLPSTIQASPTYTDHYHSVLGHVGLSIALDRIELLARHEMSDSLVLHLADSLGLVLEQKLVDRLYVFSIPFDSTSTDSALQRASVVHLARVIKGAGSAVIAEAGMAVRRAGGTVPMIVSDRFIARFKQGTLRDSINSMNSKHSVQIVEENPFRPNQFLLSVTPRSDGDAIRMSNIYEASPLCLYAHPNFVRAIRSNQYLPNDTEYAKQWHHTNDGSSGGVPDADIDTPLAWSIIQSLTNPGETIIAVIDGGFDLSHPDLTASLWMNLGEVGTDSHGHAKETNGDDDDDDGVVDDVHGYDVYDCDDATGSHPSCGDGDPSYQVDEAYDPVTGTMKKVVTSFNIHGTAVAGLAGATMDNSAGLVGTCPGAKLILIRRGTSDYALVKGFDYARTKGADVITCSWGDYEADSDPNTPSVQDAIHDAVAPPTGRGTVVLFAMDYAPTDPARGCGSEYPAWDLASNSEVIAVSAVSNLDRRLSYAACGDYVDVLSPSDRGAVTGEGTANIATTDVSGSDGTTIYYGYNSQIKIENCSSDDPDHNYTYCFTGTSAATPIAAGVAGLILTADETLSPTAVRRLLQDTADRVEPTKATYDVATGFSRPATTTSTHGYGRINAFEAVRIAAPASAGGKGGVDLFLRDNDLDWGNTEQPSNTRFESESGTEREFEPHWHSADIKVDAPPYQLDANHDGIPDTPDAKGFDEIKDEDPAPGQDNAVYMRVRNRGPAEATNVKAKVYWTRVSASMPPFPDDFWTGFATNSFTSGDWNFLGERPASGDPAVTLQNSGSTDAKEGRETATGVDHGAVFRFSWTGPSLDPDVHDHFCLLGIVDCDTDHPEGYRLVLAGTSPTPTNHPELFDADEVTPTDNNVTHRNYWVEDTASDSAFILPFYVRNASKASHKYILRWKAPPTWKIKPKGPFPPPPPGPFTIKAGESRLVRLSVNTLHPGATGTVSILQELAPPKKKKSSKATKSPAAGRPVGGLTVVFRPH